jgi:predicted PurR-regulated permease PerM
MTHAARISYGIIIALFVFIGWLHLGVLTLTLLFGYFALQQFNFAGKKFLAIAIYIIVVVAIGWGLYYFSRRAFKTLPEIANKTIPALVNFAESKQIELPFSDYATLKTMALEKVNDSVATISHYAHSTLLALAQLLIGLVAAVSLFLNAKWGTEGDVQSRGSVYNTVIEELTVRFRRFYSSFSKVMAAQILISLVNSVLTAIFLLWNHFPYAMVLIVLTFLLGLLPIVGNLLSNTLIVCVAFTTPDGPRMALFALIFLIVVHKLEYFLNSKIVGERIKNPMWLTLIGIVLGEKLMGIPGMILAPVVLHYIKVEASRNKFAGATSEIPSPAQPQ